MKQILSAALAAAMLLLCGCNVVPPQPTPTPDPHAGMVLAESGYGTKIWVKDYKDLPLNPLREIPVGDAETVTDENGALYLVQRGMDVSEHQGQIDWDALALSEQCPDFALLRAGYRGYGEEGRLCADAWFDENVRGAQKNGIPIGVYFFSQATDEAEAVEEAEFLIFLLAGYAPGEFALPVFFDWEEISGDTARTDAVDGETMTRCALAFCERLEAGGYTAGIYAYRSLAYFRYDLEAIADYPLWIAALSNTPDFRYGFDIWQQSTTGTLPGIEGSVDVDRIFLPVLEN